MSVLRLTIGLFCFSVLYGCSPKEQNSEKVHKESLPSFVAQNNVNQCDCVNSISYLACSELGISPQMIQEQRQTDESLKSLFQKMQTGKFESITFEKGKSGFQKIPIGTIPIQVLVHKNGHLYGLLGTLDINGVRLYQLIHGASQVWLATLEQLERSGFVEVWQLERAKDEVPIPVGKGTLWVDNLYYNFGEIKPASEVTCTFNLRNGGDKTIVLSKPETSCSCTISNIETIVKIEPSKLFLLEISLISSQSISTRQMVGMKCYEEGSGISQQFSLDLFANQRESMEIVPKSLDFGLVIPHEEVRRTVTFKEVPTDRFSVSKIDFGNLPLTYVIQEMVALDGMKYYQTELQFILKDERIEGKQHGEIMFITDSYQFPQVKIPVIYEVAPIVQAIPGIVSFGTVRVGEKNRTEVKFESRNGFPIEVKVESLPEGITFEKKGEVYQVDFVSKNEGVWRNEIKLILVSGSHQIPTSLPCVAFVRAINK
jgi:hypothetical protein